MPSVCMMGKTGLAFKIQFDDFLPDVYEEHSSVKHVQSDLVNMDTLGPTQLVHNNEGSILSWGL